MEGDDKLLLALSPEATTHIINQMGNDCPHFQADPEGEGAGCELCAEVITEATKALAGHAEREMEEEREGPNAD